MSTIRILRKKRQAKEPRTHRLKKEDGEVVSALAMYRVSSQIAGKNITMAHPILATYLFYTTKANVLA